MHLGWSSRTYPLYADDLAALPDYAGPEIPQADLPDDEIVVFMRKNAPDALLRGRKAVAAAARGTVDARIVFVPSVAKWNLAGTLVRLFRNIYRYKSSNTYHIRTSDIRRMGLERAIRTLDNPHKRRNIDRRAKMEKLENSLKAKGYDDTRPIAIMLLRSRGAEDSLRQGHHRISACISCGIEKMAVRFSAAGALPKCLRRFARKPRTRIDVFLQSLSNAFSVPLERIVRIPGRGQINLVAVPERGGRFVVKLASSMDAAQKMANVIKSSAKPGATSLLFSGEPVPAGRYFAVACKYARGKSLPLDTERRRLKMNLSLDLFKQTMESGWNIKVASIKRLDGHAHSINYRVTTQDGLVFAAKLVPAARFYSLRRLLAHAEMAIDANTTSLLFGGKVLDAGNWNVIAMRWIFGRRYRPEELSAAEIAAMIDAHRKFTAALSNDGHILPARDPESMRAELLKRCKHPRMAPILREIELIDPARLPPSALKIIHGDLHFENFRFKDGGDIGFLDIEELRWGTPAEDVVRYILSRAERLGPFSFIARHRLLKTFRRFVKMSRCTKEEWRFAIDTYLLKKLLKKIPRSGLGFFAVANLSYRFRLYRTLRRLAAALAPSGRTEKRTIVKLVGGTVRRFTGAGGLDWKGKYLFTAEPGCETYDWLCVYDEIPPRHCGRIKLECPAANTMLLTQEPESIKRYSQMYIDQFAVVMTNRSDIPRLHPCCVKGAGYMVWYTGRSFSEEKARAHAEKTKSISAVYSAKRMNATLHGVRFELLEYLEKNLEGFDRFGKGIRKIEKKSDAIDAYKYHVAFENHVQSGFWTEKIADAIVCRALPFYAGDPDIGKVLPEGSFIPLSPDATPEETAAAIKKAISDGEYEKRKDAVEEARNLLFEKYNLFAQIVSAIESAPPSRMPPEAPAEGAILSRRRIRLHPPALVAYAVRKASRLFSKWRAK